MHPAIASGQPPKANRRSEPRVLRQARVIEIAVGNVRVPFTLGNLSSLGAFGRCGRAILSGSRVQLWFEGNRLLEGQVRWSRGPPIEIHFSSRLPMDLLTRRNGPATARARRFAVNRPGKVVTANGDRIATIRNVSENGMLVETSLTLAPGQQVRIDCGALTIEGQVRWARQGLAGIQFLAPLCPEQFGGDTTGLKHIVGQGSGPTSGMPLSSGI